MLKELILKNRTYRRFYQSEKISAVQLRDWVDLARNSASARNGQSMKYILSTDEMFNAQIFEQLAWAGYLTTWKGPEEGERPSAYIVLMNDTLIAGKLLLRRWNCHAKHSAWRNRNRIWRLHHPFG